MFSYLKQAKDLTKYNLMTGTTDFSNLAQFNMYESGYAALFVIKIPKFLEELAIREKDNPDTDKKNTMSYKTLINNYKHILEREFKSIDGLEDISTESQAISDGINELNIITQVRMQGGTDFGLTYQEKSGSPITRVHELYLRGIRDPRGGQVKHYHGLIEQGMEASYENETFTFLYVVTDNTMRNIEKAYLIVSAQITNAPLSIYEYTKGSIEFKDVTVTMHGFPITSPAIDEIAQQFLAKYRTTKGFKFNSAEATAADYKGIDDAVTAYSTY